MDKAYSITKRTTGFWFFSRHVLVVQVSVLNGKKRLVLEKILQVLSIMVPEIRYIKSEMPLVSGVRGSLKRPPTGGYHDQYDMIILEGYIDSAQIDEHSEDPEKIPFSHTLSSRFDSFNTEKNTILYSLYSTITPEFAALKERVSVIDTIRNSSFVIKKCRFGVETFLFSNIISRWSNVPVVDLSITITTNESSINLKIDLDPDLQEKDLHIVSSLLEVISEYLLSNGQESFYPQEVLKVAKSKSSKN